nr:MAG TPA: hypothetical protein [Caudoviricetes sp.]
MPLVWAVFAGVKMLKKKPTSSAQKKRPQPLSQ